MSASQDVSRSDGFARRTIRAGKLAAFVGLSLGAVALVFGPLAADVIGDTAGSSSKRALDFASLGFKFEGASVCGGGTCHGGGAIKAPANRKAAIGNAFSVWDSSDKHQNAYKTLTKPASAAIVKALGHTGDAK